jgi:L-threonylcarbamoyladenylate synthase
MDSEQLQAALDLLGSEAPSIAVYARVILKTPSGGVIRRRMPDDAHETARQLFAVLREFDAQGVGLIWVEMPPDTPEWAGVRDRLKRAAAG